MKREELPLFLVPVEWLTLKVRRFRQEDDWFRRRRDNEHRSAGGLVYAMPHKFVYATQVAAIAAKESGSAERQTAGR
jgi:hypothetical protein